MVDPMSLHPGTRRFLKPVRALHARTGDYLVILAEGEGAEMYLVRPLARGDVQAAIGLGAVGSISPLPFGSDVVDYAPHSPPPRPPSERPRAVRLLP